MDGVLLNLDAVPDQGLQPTLGRTNPGEFSCGGCARSEPCLLEPFGFRGQAGVYRGVERPYNMGYKR